MDNSRLQYLVSQYLNDACTPEEIEALWKGLQELRDESSIEDTLQPLWDASKMGSDTPPLGWQHTLNRIYSEAGEIQHQQTMVLKRRHRALRWAVAASVILIIGTISYFSFPKKISPSKTIINAGIAGDIKAPQNSKATITLADGQTIAVDSISNGVLASQGAVNLIKLANGQIAYQTAAGEVLKELQYNTLSNPRGSKVIDMQLSDGSHVWLNAGSSITYPVAFVDDERKVELKGEGYFEVAKNPKKKFIVSSNGLKTEVLGTHFNVNAYGGAPDIQVTLLEGNVRVSSGKGSLDLRPGQQARSAASTHVMKLIPDADISQVMAWKNGVFYLNNIRMTELMQQIANWYDVDVVYPSGIPDVELFGKIGRDLNLSQVLQGLKAMDVQCRLEGRILYVN